ncbi:RNA cap guanine-N2 methyltransferase-domain-containing protein [Chytriomyces cf. hyalinus JEL632]|nr:RNA cap guanine-N2 methyltransferase-domain-containing protein [Chytriomyces cf. hyalinus JEL632]
MDESDSNSEYEEATAALPQSATATAEDGADAAAKTKRKRRKRPKRKRKAAKTDADAAETEAAEPVQANADEPAILEADTHAATQVQPFDFEAFEQMVDMNEARLDWAADSVPKELQKYWRHRFSLFTLFDQGIKLDHAESWFSVTPEKVAAHIATRCGNAKTVIDAFCGAGGNSIQFALAGYNVISVDIDPVKLVCARKNAEIYGALDRITFINGDFMQISHQLKGDIVFLSPPWGGPEYLSHDTYDIKTMIPMDGEKLFEQASEISPNIMYYVPKNSDADTLIALAGPGGECELEEVYLNDRAKVLVVYYGNLAKGEKNE